MPYFNIVAAASENTVVTEYEPVIACSDSYQSEAALEKEFIRLLQFNVLSLRGDSELFYYKTGIQG